MRIALITLLILSVGHSPSSAASRTWKLRNGTELKAEFIGGILDNKIVLKAPGNRRHYFRLSEFGLADRDYIVNFFTDRNDPEDRNQLLALMAFENTVQAIDPEAPPANSSNENSGFNRPGPRMPVGGGPFNPLRPNNAPQTPTLLPAEMYGIPLPSPELLVEDQVRSWTNLTGQKLLYRFDRALAPGHFRLKKADGTTDEFAIVNFSKADIDHVKQLLAADMSRPVFPAGNGFQSLTPDDVSRGYRVWTDRKNVPLIGKFVAIKGRNVVIEADGIQEEYPRAGLSETDRDWIDNEIRRRSEESQAASRQSATNRSSSNPGMSRFPESRFSPFGRPGGHGENFAGNSNVGGHGDNSNNRFRTPTAPVLEFHFQCPKCGHEWTEANTSISRCPQCTGANRIDAGASAGHSSSYQQSAPQPTASSHSSFDSSPATDFAGTSTTSSSTQGQGALMTIFYVLMGIGVLAGLAAGLFRAFG